MTPEQRQTLDTVKKLLGELEIFNFHQLDDESNTFTVETRLKLKPQVLPIFIIAPAHRDEEIMLTWVIEFSPENIDSLRLVDKKLKNDFVEDVRYQFGLLNLPLRIYPSPEEINHVLSESFIPTKELSKQTLGKKMIQLGFALNLFGKKFEKYFPFPPSFDPSFHV